MTLKHAAPYMCKRSCFRTPFGSQRINMSQKLLKSARNHFDPFDWSIRDEMSWNMSLLLRSEMLHFFCYHWVLMTSIVVIIRRISHNQFKFKYLRTQNCFFQILSRFWNLNKFLNIPKKRWVSQLKYLWYNWLRNTRLLNYTLQ